MKLSQVGRSAWRHFSRQAEISQAFAKLRATVSTELAYEAKNADAPAADTRQLRQQGWTAKGLDDLVRTQIVVSKQVDDLLVSVEFDAKSPSARMEDVTAGQPDPASEEEHEAAIRADADGEPGAEVAAKDEPQHPEVTLLKFRVTLKKTGAEGVVFEGTTDGAHGTFDGLDLARLAGAHRTVVRSESLEEEGVKLIEEFLAALGVDKAFYRQMLLLATQKDQKMYADFLTTLKTFLTPEKKELG